MTEIPHQKYAKWLRLVSPKAMTQKALVLVLTQDNSSKQGGGAAAVTNGSNGAGTSGGGKVASQDTARCMMQNGLILQDDVILNLQ